MNNETHPQAENNLTFKTLGIHPEILKVLDRNKFTIPTPIQNKVIPLGIQGKDIIGIAQTGTGKTLAFGIPMIERLLANRHTRGLVVLPTRELAIQVEETLHRIGSTLGITTAVLIGGESVTKQMRLLKLNPMIMIATPGRLIDHVKQGNARLDNVSIVVLDEADHMFDIGFAPQVRDIMRRVSKNRQTLLFSATMPNEIATLAMEHMKLPLRIEMAPQGTAAKNVDQEIIVVNRHTKFPLLSSIIAKEDKTTPVLVFSRTKHGAKDISLGLRNQGITAVEIHGNRSLGQRKEALEGFKQHRYQVLVATDIAARGIDVKDIGLVINYDLPEQSEDYVHRIGRTGRAGKAGRAISFATPDQKFDIVAIEKLMKRSIPTRQHNGASLPAVTMGIPRGGSAMRDGEMVGGSFFCGNGVGAGPKRFGRPAPAGAFKIHTNQPFKGGAPKNFVSSRPPLQRPAHTSLSKPKPSGSHPWQRPKFARTSSAPKPFRNDPNFIAGFKGGYEGSKPKQGGTFRRGR